MERLWKYFANEKPNKLSLKLLVISALLWAVSAKPSHAQQSTDSSYLTILSPQPGSVVRDGELFIAIQLNHNESFNKTSVTLWMDGYMVNYQAKVTDKKVTLLYSNHLSKGRHWIRLNAKTADGGVLIPLRWEFFIGNPDSAKKDTVEPIQKDEAPKPKNFEMRGNISLTSRNLYFSGEGTDLRQEPLYTPNNSYTHELNVNVEPRYKKVSFPIQSYLTTNERKEIQGRDRFRVGIKSDYAEAYYGAQYPIYDQLVMNGVRIQGVEVVGKLRKVQLNVVHGYSERQVEGSLERLRSTDPFIPYNLRPDSTYIIPGTYRREVTAGKFTFGKAEEGSIFGITFMKSKDDTSSIRYGNSPKENVALGFDQELITQNRVFKLTSGFAMSLVTNDYTRGTVTSEDFDTLYRADPPFNPADFKWLININSTSSPLMVQQRSSMAWYVKTQTRIKFNTLTTDYRRTGPEYVSFGNPFLRTDMQELSATDVVNIWRRRIVIMLKYTNNENNLYNKALNKVINNIYLGSLTLAPHRKAPQLTIGYRQTDRATKYDLFPSRKLRDKLETYNANLSYNAKWAAGQTLLLISSSRTKRTATMLANSTFANVISGTLNQDLNAPVSIGLNYTQFSVANFEGISIQKLATYGGNITYKIRKYKIELTASAGLNESLPTIYSDHTSRNTYQFSYRHDIWKGMCFQIDAGVSRFLQDDSPEDYDERFVNGGLSYTF